MRNLNRVEGKLLDLLLPHCSQRDADELMTDVNTNLKKIKKRNMKQDRNIVRIGIVLLSIRVFFPAVC